jgi:hypothetical protein
VPFTTRESFNGTMKFMGNLRIGSERALKIIVLRIF